MPAPFLSRFSRTPYILFSLSFYLSPSLYNVAFKSQPQSPPASLRALSKLNIKEGGRKRVSKGRGKSRGNCFCFITGRREREGGEAAAKAKREERRGGGMRQTKPEWIIGGRSVDGGATMDVVSCIRENRGREGRQSA